MSNIKINIKIWLDNFILWVRISLLKEKEKIKETSPLDYNHYLCHVFFRDLKRNKLPCIPEPSKDEISEYMKKNCRRESNLSSYGDISRIESNASIPIEIKIWVDKIYDYYFYDLVPILGMAHLSQGAIKALYDHKGYKWYTFSECYPGVIFD